MAFEEGPYIQAACFCDMVIEDKNGVLSLIRVIDRVTRTIRASSPPDEMPPGPYKTHLVLMLKSGSALGRSALKVVPRLPSGETRDPVNVTVHFEGEEKGQNVVMNMEIPLEMEGLYWFEVYIDEEKLTSIPLRVIYNPIVTGTASQ